ncbi:MAG TPA: glutathione peroxidase [Terracidiphilus sp.]|nr:glutathione peroxidase [Terracidiphilus sp.]
MPQPQPQDGIYSFSAPLLDSQLVNLGSFRGRVLLIVNTASECGFTPQYEGLEHLYRANKDRGLTVLAFPCNQFGAQEPGTSEQIAYFCSCSYGVSFPVFARIEVNGHGAHPLYQYLTAQRRGILGTRRIKWNFTKFLVDRNGRVVARYAPATKPEALSEAIERLLTEPAA